MLRVVTRGSKRQLKLGVPNNPFMKRFNHKNKLCSQVNGIQEFDVHNNEQEQLVTVNLSIHHIPTKHEEKSHKYFQLVNL